MSSLVRSRTGAVLALAAAAIIVGVFAVAPDDAYAKPKGVKVRVYDAQGRKVSGATVHVFQGDKPVCKCDGPDCVLDSVAEATTNKSGQVRISGLSANTQYAFAVSSSCSNHSGMICEDPELHCLCVQGGYETETTNKKGGASRTIELTSSG